MRLCRELAQARPDAFTPNLAMSLSNLAGFLGDLGRREAALEAADEAVCLRRKLAQARPDAFTPALARSLAVRAKCLKALGRDEDAFADERDSIGLRALGRHASS